MSTWISFHISLKCLFMLIEHPVAFDAEFYHLWPWVSDHIIDSGFIKTHFILQSGDLSSVITCVGSHFWLLGTMFTTCQVELCIGKHSSVWYIRFRMRVEDWLQILFPLMHSIFFCWDLLPFIYVLKVVSLFHVLIFFSK